MPLNLQPFALVRLAAQSPEELVGHVLVTPWQVAFISPTSERVTDCSWALASLEHERVRAALIEYARWPLPLVLGKDDEVHALLVRLAPSARQVQVVALNLSSASSGTLVNQLIAWRTADMVPGWVSVVAAMQKVASCLHPGPLRSIDDRGLDDTPLFTLTTGEGQPIVTMAVWPSSGRLRAWVYQDQGNWIERVYWVAANGTWVVRNADETVLRSLPSAMDIARDVLNPVAEEAPPRHEAADTDVFSYDVAFPSW